MRVVLLRWSKSPQSIAIAQDGGLGEFAQYIGQFLDDAPVEFFEEWFQTPFMHWVGADPFRRGGFARGAGFSTVTLGLWNLVQAQSKVAEAAVALKHKRIGFGEFKDIVRAYEEGGAE